MVTVNKKHLSREQTNLGVNNKGEHVLASPVQRHRVVFDIYPTNPSNYPSFVLVRQFSLARLPIRDVRLQSYPRLASPTRLFGLDGYRSLHASSKSRIQTLDTTDSPKDKTEPMDLLQIHAILVGNTWQLHSTVSVAYF